jgi:uncharacterized protein YecA (UPF0149 family)
MLYVQVEILKPFLEYNQNQLHRLPDAVLKSPAFVLAHKRTGPATRAGPVDPCGSGGKACPVTVPVLRLWPLPVQ